MRWLLGTLLTSSHHVRHRPPALLGAIGQPFLAEEEYKALAGVWRADLELDDGDASLSLHLAAPGSQQFDTATQGGKVYPIDADRQKLPFAHRAHAWSAARWSAHRTVRAGTEGDGELCFALQLGNLHLEGRGERSGLHCSNFAGTVLEGGLDDPYVLGRFSMHLALPFETNASTLEERYQQRLAKQPAPPLSFSVASFIGRWQLLLAVDV